VPKKVLYLITEDWFFCSHFIERAKAAKESGYDVYVACNVYSHEKTILDAGLKIIPINFMRKSVNPIRELSTLYSIIKVYLRVKPSIVHHIAAKPIFYGSIAAMITKVKLIVNAPVGMGYVFSSTSFKAITLRPFIKLAYRFLLNPSDSKVVFENGDDLKQFVNSGCVNQNDAVLIRGAGVNLKDFSVVSRQGLPVIVLVARMLRDKGIYEFVQAANSLFDQGVKARFLLVGDPDESNPASIKLFQLQQWHGHKGVEYLGWTDNVSKILEHAHIACLPSYREGLPKSLLESAAACLPIVTTDTVGCREVVIDGYNGLLVPIKDSNRLAEALKKLILNASLCRQMGMRSRVLVFNEFTSEKVIQATLDIYSTKLSKINGL
jgi:glycosyltransferase involved in cell wall biosynthesis